MVWRCVAVTTVAGGCRSGGFATAAAAASGGLGWFGGGLGLVPPYPLGRLYRDALGRANQRLAAAADEVLFMVAGLPLALKPTR